MRLPALLWICGNLFHQLYMKFIQRQRFTSMITFTFPEARKQTSGWCYEKLFLCFFDTQEILKLAKRVWCYRRIFLKHPKRYTDKNKKIMNEIILSCKENLLSNILVLKDRIRDIFENSSSQDEAYVKKTNYTLRAGIRKILTLKRLLSYLWAFLYVSICFFIPTSKESLFQDLVIKRISLNWLDPRKVPDMVLELPKGYRII